jgi:hypothetical protein
MTVDTAVLDKYFVPEGEWQELWFTTLSRPWSSLVVVPASAGLSALAVARTLAEVGKLHRGRSISLIDAETVELADATRLIDTIHAKTALGDQVIVSVSALFDNQAAIPIARAADAALLCIALGVSDFSSAKKTLGLVGPDRFVGTVNLK